MARKPTPSLAAILLHTLLLACAMSVACNGTRTPPGAVEEQGSRCPTGEAVETDGHRRLALIVGVGTYKKPGLDLAGPPNDARRIHELLTGRNGYGFPEQNVCLLLNADATTAGFRQAFDDALVARAESGDVAVVFYAGHGSQVRDRNRDEPDEWDETFVLHDARTDGVRDLVDDEFNAMLGRLHEKTENITVILDSCNSSTATRRIKDATLVPRLLPAADESSAAPETLRAAGGDGGRGWVPEDLSGLVVMAAAKDGTPAMETEGRGIFTDAVLDVLSGVGATPLTYAQAARRIPLVVEASGHQIPFFHGDLTKPVFGNTGRKQPIGWEITALGTPIELAGPILPGMGANAEMRVYDGATTGADTSDPARSKATLVVDKTTGLNAEAHVDAFGPNAAAMAVGDLAILVRPADDFLRIKVRLRESDRSGGIPESRARELRRAITEGSETKLVVDLTDGGADFELSLSIDGQLQLRGPEHRVRYTHESETGEAGVVADLLWQQARQRAMVQLQGEGGSDFRDNHSLELRLVEAPRNLQNSCADGVWTPAAGPNTDQLMPLCHAWQVHVRLREDAPKSLLVGGAVLSNDGSIYGFPTDGRQELLAPGDDTTFALPAETYRAWPPLDVQERVLVFGTQETNPVPWHLLTRTVSERSAAARSADAPPMGTLYRALERYLEPGTRGARPLDDAEDTTWTMSTVPFRVVANSDFLKPEAAAEGRPKTREYTIPNFDVRPYLPDDVESVLYKVLQEAHKLAIKSVSDGVPYRQHSWDGATDEENLQLGIDCSRSIWFAFTRAGIPYNDGDDYLSTAMMVGENTHMRDRFQSCQDDPQFRLGDVIVYRDETRKVGHTVMVIDPDKRIAWGSHGWDGNVRLQGLADTGVEYQLIKYKRDWDRWDRSTMDRVACWRHRQFVAAEATPGGQAGVKALAEICNEARDCGRSG